MAKNRQYAECREVALVVPDGTKSGAFLVIGDLPCVALEDQRTDGSKKATCQFDGGYRLPVKGVKKGGNQKVEIGKSVFVKGGELTVNNEEGVFFGYALEEVAAGATATIVVKVGH